MECQSKAVDADINNDIGVLFLLLSFTYLCKFFAPECLSLSLYVERRGGRYGTQGRGTSVSLVRLRSQQHASTTPSNRMTRTRLRTVPLSDTPTVVSLKDKRELLLRYKQQAGRDRTQVAGDALEYVSTRTTAVAEWRAAYRFETTYDVQVLVLLY
jgi:hypothetical protein